ncbi:hypothetical protein CQ018_09125 [Arthrobacter sp. MYb227]|nr:hypothetical protein CQ018_09125 [Arthrobacter sp. MYb227]
MAGTSTELASYAVAPMSILGVSHRHDASTGEDMEKHEARDQFGHGLRVALPYSGELKAHRI